MSYLTSNLNLQNSAINASVQNYTEVTIARKAALTNKPTQQRFTGRIEETNDSLILPNTPAPTPLESKTTVPPARGVNTLSSIQTAGTLYITATNVPTKAQQAFSSALPTQYVDSTGVGLTVNITAALGIVTEVSICNPGRNYNVGDLITILAGNNDATISVSSLLGAPLAKTHEPGFIQLDQGGYQLPTGSWGEFMEIYSVSNNGGAGGANQHLLVTTKTPHGLSPNDKVDINDLPGLNINNFTVIGVKDENTFEINNTQEVALPLPGTTNATIRARRAKAAPSQAGVNMLPKSSVSVTKNLPIALLSLQTNMPGSSENGASLPSETFFGSDELGVDFSRIPPASLAGNGLPGVIPTVANLASIYPDFNTKPANAVNTPVFCPEIFGQVGNSFGISRGAATTEANALLQLNLNELYKIP